ncbi:transporter [Pseudanabaena sp. SR411]|uniref:ArsB/NhaD family transporter n=1 Tax=Pseudanabaena sp. SR411 TaxID=1980935 RepID=UPI000B98AC38|nr:ArsB/NhaD family transporter [Pseudanabaena sp. SR411]OYQ63620.1 transporter [Pseudanabaena sp. SR411]
MDNWQAIFTGVTFVVVIILIVTERVHLTIAAFLGALLLVAAKIMSLEEATRYVGRSYATISLLFGVMVMVRAFEPTKIFDYLAVQIVLLSKGKGSRLLLAIVGITSLVCALLPNATTITLLAPMIPPLAKVIGIDFVPLIILMVVVSNSAGLLTLVGDPATFIVGNAINVSFADYLMRLSFVGVISIAIIVCTLPFLFGKIWRKNIEISDRIEVPKINHPRTLIIGGLISLFVLVLFVMGESLPTPISPAAVALLGAGLSLFLSHHNKIDSINHVLRDVDWSTLLFFMSTFVLIGGLQKTGLIAQASSLFASALGTNIALAAIVVLISVAVISSVIPNIPLVVAMVPMMKEYLVNVDLAPSWILVTNFNGQFPDEVLPLFYAMMFGATLGGNATVVGASANIVGAGISEIHGKSISFSRFAKYGIPIAALQILGAAIFISVRFLVFAK